MLVVAIALLLTGCGQSGESGKVATMRNIEKTTAPHMQPAEAPSVQKQVPAKEMQQPVSAQVSTQSEDADISEIENEMQDVNQQNASSNDLDSLDQDLNDVSA